MGNGAYKSSVLVPGYVVEKTFPLFYSSVQVSIWCIFFGRKKEAFYLGPPPKDKFPKVLLYSLFHSFELGTMVHVMLLKPLHTSNTGIQYIELAISNPWICWRLCMNDYLERNYIREGNFNYRLAYLIYFLLIPATPFSGFVQYLLT